MSLARAEAYGQSSLSVLPIVGCLAIAVSSAAIISRSEAFHSGFGVHGAARQAVGLSTPVGPAPLSPPAAEVGSAYQLPADVARQVNSSLPFVADGLDAAKPFRFSGTAADREMAATCLATAVWYEAGNDKLGQQAVAQVVLNRLRHSAFPKTVCGVVFQGSERSTGCQFSFTCDGSLARRAIASDWKNARQVADRALAGFVLKDVGLATHYHTDWVVPYWSATLDKIAKVHTHIFYRWRAGWGSPSAFLNRYAGAETIDPRIRSYADQSKIPAVPVALVATGTETPPLDVADARPQSIDIEGVTAAGLKGAVVRLADLKDGRFAIDVSQIGFPGSFALAALNLCANRLRCEVFGWSDASSMPAQLPTTAVAHRTAAFIYEKDKDAGVDRARWNCQRFPRPDSSQCIAKSHDQEIAVLSSESQNPASLSQ